MTVPTNAEAQSRVMALRGQIEDARWQLKMIDNGQRDPKKLEQMSAEWSSELARLESAYEGAQADAQEAFTAYHHQQQDRAARRDRIRQRVERYQQHLQSTAEQDWPKEDW